MRINHWHKVGWYSMSSVKFWLEVQNWPDLLVPFLEICNSPTYSTHTFSVAILMCYFFSVIHERLFPSFSQILFEDFCYVPPPWTKTLAPLVLRKLWVLDSAHYCWFPRDFFKVSIFFLKYSVPDLMQSFR